MTPISSFRPRVAARIPSASDPLIDLAVLDACIDFCEQSRAVRGMLDTFTTTAGTSEYDLLAVNEQAVSRILRVWVDDTEIGGMDDNNTPSPTYQTQSTPQAFSNPEPEVLALHPTPDKAYTINLRVALRPTRSATQVRDELFERHVETIVNGALARLYSMPGEPFFNTQLASAHAAGFKIGINAAMLDASKGRTSTQLRVTPVHI